MMYRYRYYVLKEYKVQSTKYVVLFFTVRIRYFYRTELLRLLLAMPWLSLAVMLNAQVSVSGHWDPMSVGTDLACSACELFVEQYLSKCSHYVYGAGKREIEGGRSVVSVYQERILSIFEEFDPAMARGKKRKKVEGVLAKQVKKGLFPARRIHDVYTKLCEKYGIEPEEIYEGLKPTGTEKERKLRLTLAALNSTLEEVASKEVQWAISGVEPNRKYVDFDKAMSSGNAESISSGGDIKDQLEKAFKFHAGNHKDLLTVKRIHTFSQE